VFESKLSFRPNILVVPISLNNRQYNKFLAWLNKSHILSWPEETLGVVGKTLGQD
jgi:hypothetical protein